MKFIADEGIDYLIVDALRREGHSVNYVAEISPGVSDTIVLDMANKEKAILLTNDKDFGDLVFRQQLTSEGVVLIRLHGLTSAQKAELVKDVILKLGPELVNSFSVITPQKIRIRPRLR